jgi:hypothetical protein
MSVTGRRDSEISTFQPLRFKSTNVHYSEVIYHIVHNDNLVPDIKPRLAMINLLQRYRREDFDDDTLLFIVGKGFTYYRPQKDIEMNMQDRKDAVLQLTATLLAGLSKSDANWIEVLYEAIEWCYTHEVLQWLLNIIKGALDRDNFCWSVLHAGLRKRLLFRDPESLKEIFRRTKFTNRCAVRGTPDITTQTPTMLAMYDEDSFLAWKLLLQELSINIRDFISTELQDGLLAKQGWDDEALTYLFMGSWKRDPYEGSLWFNFHICERCGDNGSVIGTRPKVDLLFRRKLRDIRLKRHLIADIVNHLNPQSLEVILSYQDQPAISNTTIDYEEINATCGGHSSVRYPEPLPYRIVCSKNCQDSICVAWLYENDLDTEPYFPAYPFVFESPNTEEDSWPSWKMPGAFKS